MNESLKQLNEAAEKLHGDYIYGKSGIYTTIKNAILSPEISELQIKLKEYE